MNDICDMWSMPWHALQRSLALGLGPEAGPAAAAAPRTARVRGAALAANSWLGRAQLRAVPTAASRQPAGPSL